MLILLAGCGTDPMPDTLTYHSSYLSMTIEHPKDWHVADPNGHGGVMSISPNPPKYTVAGILNDGDTDPAFLIIAREGDQKRTNEEYLQRMVDSLVNDMDNNLALDGDIETIKIGGQSALRQVLKGEMRNENDRMIPSQIQLIVTSSKDASIPFFIIINSPTAVWENYEDTFEAMLSRIKFD
jgi:hypothetical protein